MPDNQARYANDPRFSNTLPDGRKFTTVGAGPVDGKLVSGKDRKRDVRQDVNNFDERLNDGSGRTDDELMEALLEAESNFNSNRNYDTFPGVQPGYNSNSFISGLLNFLNLSASDTPSRAPGFDKPVPSEDFEPEQGP